MAGARRAPTRHRSRRRSGGATSASMYAASVGVALVIALGVIFVIQRTGSSGSSCSGTTVLSVTTTPTLAGPIEQVADGYNRARHTVGSTCATVKVTAAPAADTLTLLQHGGTGSGADGTTEPDVWVPDSANWLAIARTSPAAARLLPTSGTPVATSPIVIASPMPMAKAAGWPATQLTWAKLAKDETDTKFWANLGHATWGPFKVGFANPAASMASLQAEAGLASANVRKPAAALDVNSYAEDRSVQINILNLERGAAAVPATPADLIAGQHAVDAKGGTGYLSAFPLQEADLVAYNRGSGGQPPAVQLAASYPTDGLFNETIPYVTTTLAAGDPTRSRLSGEFLADLQTADGAAALTSAGFRAPDGSNQGLTVAIGAQPNLPATQPATRPGPVLAAAQSLFRHIHQRGSTLAVLDISGSMGEIVPGAGGKTKLQVALDAAIQSLPLFASDDYVGTWAFSTNLPNGKNYEEVVPIARLDSPGVSGPKHLDDLANNIKGLTPRGNTALYETALAAYQKAESVYRPGRLNQVVLLTDGENDDPGDPGNLSLPTLLSKLHALFNPAKPVRIITIAYGAEADPQALQQISDATGAKSYQSRNPNDILNVFIDAVTQSD